MKVRVEQGRIEGQVIAHIGAVVALFPKRERNPEVGTEVDVMITGYKIAENPNLNGIQQMIASPRVYFVRLIRHDDLLVRHLGFEMSGSMCSTTATLQDDIAGLTFLTPGRVNVYVAENVNVGKSGSYEPRVPGLAYIKNERGQRRIEGVPDIEQLCFWQHQNNPDVIRVRNENEEAYQSWLRNMESRSSLRSVAA